MAAVNYKKYLGIAICSFYGAVAFAGIVQILTNKFGLYNLSISRVVWIIQDLVCCCSMIYIAFNKVIKAALPERIGASILAALFISSMINILLSFAEINIFSSLGQYASFIITIIEMCAAALLFYHIKAWLPIRISAFVFWIPTLCSSFYLSKLKIASELAQMNSDWSLVESIIDDTVLCDYIALALAIITINFTAIWIGRKPKAQHIQSNPIDII